jgi:hypothetical protein
VATSATFLYQIRLTGENSPWEMGIAAGEARIGDLVCWIPKVEKAVIVRKNGTWSQIIGRAVVPNDLGNAKTGEYFGSHEEVGLGVGV